MNKYLLAILFAFVFSVAIQAENSCDFNYQSDLKSFQEIINPPNNSKVDSTWIGADVGTSIELNKDTYLWLFGDTLLGTVASNSRQFNGMVNNSIGITHCKNASRTCKKITKYINTEQGKIKSFFTLKDINQHYWPTAGAKLNTKLFITGYVLSNINKNKDWLPIVGTNFILIDNPNDAPSNWHYKDFNVKNTSKNLNWATAVVKNGDWLYIFGDLKLCNNKSCDNTVLSRIKISDAQTENWDNMEYWLKNQIWSKKFNNISDLEPVTGLPGTSEISVGYNANFGWYTVQIPAFSHEVHLYTADKLTGPWLEKGIIFSIPEPLYLKGFIIYAAKIHAELAKSINEIVLTYNINQTDINQFIENIKNPYYFNLYVPQFLKTCIK